MRSKQEHNCLADYPDGGKLDATEWPRQYYLQENNIYYSLSRIWLRASDTCGS